MSGYLYRFEARGIQSYILGHRKLKRLLGASAIVRELVEVELPRVLTALKMDPAVQKGDMLMSAAGMAMIKFPSVEKLQAFLRVWPYIVSTKAPGLRTVHAWVEGHHDSPATHTDLDEALRQARCTPPVDLPAGNPVMDRSQYRKLPALPRPVRNEDGNNEVVDAAAQSAIDAEVNLEAVIYTGPDGEPLKRPTRPFPYDLNEMTDGRYIAIIHADGNGIGDWFDRTDGFADRQKNSEHLKAISLKALRAAIQVIDVRGTERLLGVPILFGGDDLVMLVRADKAIEFLRAYNETFMEGFAKQNADRKKAGAKPICISAGVAFVRPNHAFHLAHRLAADLGKRAKQASARAFSSVWFHRFTDLLADTPSRALCPIPLEGTVLDAALEVAGQLKRREIARGPIRTMLTAVEAHDPRPRASTSEPRDEHGREAQAIWDRFSEVHELRLGEKFASLKSELDKVHPGLSARPFVLRANPADPSQPERFSPWPDINTLAVVQEATLKETP